MTDYLKFKADLDDPAVAEAYDDFSYWSSMFGQLLFRHLPLDPQCTVLDIGFGTGFPLIELADRLGPDANIYGLDAWAHAVERARMKTRIRGNKNVHIADGDGANMPYEDNFFDLIVSNLGVNNFENPSVVMAECHRVCKPEGRLALTTNLVGHMSEFYLAYEDTLKETGNAHLVEPLQRQQSHRATLPGLQELFSKAGFEITTTHTEAFTLRYASGSAFLRSYLSRLGFLEGWRSVLKGSDQETEIFEALEARLNRIAEDASDGLRLSIPAAYVEGRRSL